MPRLTNDKILSRFWSKVKKTDSCWNWVGPKSGDGYGVFNSAYKKHRAHRFSYELHKGVIHNKMGLDHLCRNILCINPDHLEPVTQAENIRRGRASGGILYLPPTHCKRGHEFKPENIYYSKPENLKNRRCKTCLFKTVNDRYERLKREGITKTKEYLKRQKEHHQNYLNKMKAEGKLEDFIKRKREIGKAYYYRKKQA